MHNVTGKREMNRVVEFSEYGGPNVLRLVTDSQADPAEGDVRVRMSAIALNRANSMFREGTYLFEATFPSRIGTEGVGVIDAIGANVSGWRIGQRVNLLPPDSESSSGYAADFNTVSQDRLLPAPEGLGDRQAATAWIPFLTIYHLFVERELASKGKWIVLPAASSSVALAANSLAHHLGAQTIGITRTREKQEALLEAGFDALVFSEDMNIANDIKRFTPDGVDLVFDPVGGAALTELVSSVKHGGEINVYGGLDNTVTPLPVFELMKNGAKISCYTVYDLLSDPERLKAAVEFFLPLFNSGALVPVADEREFPLDQIGDAFTHLESNTQFGKVTVVV
jgi:NADPH:quinone reductase-like Zn-dependent oxidoreductase